MPRLDRVGLRGCKPEAELRGPGAAPGFGPAPVLLRFRSRSRPHSRSRSGSRSRPGTGAGAERGSRALSPPIGAGHANEMPFYGHQAPPPARRAPLMVSGPGGCGSSPARAARREAPAPSPLPCLPRVIPSPSAPLFFFFFCVCSPPPDWAAINPSPPVFRETGDPRYPRAVAGCSFLARV